MSDFVILNLESARFECSFGRGCEGVCCRNGRPMLYPEDSAAIDPHLPLVLPRMRPQARALVEKQGYVSRRRKEGKPVVRVAAGWCVFFNHGCLLHSLAKPFVCAVFPISRDRGPWYVRQKGFRHELWDLPCLDPSPTTPRAVDSLQSELALLKRHLSGQ